MGDVNCKICAHVGVCVVRQKLQEQVVLEFPDGARAVADMESALVLCDHFTPTMAYADAPRGAPPTPQANGGDPLEQMDLGEAPVLDEEDALANDFTPPAQLAGVAQQVQQPEPQMQVAPAGSDVVANLSPDSPLAKHLAAMGLLNQHPTKQGVAPKERVVGVRKGGDALLKRTKDGRVQIKIGGRR